MKKLIGEFDHWGIKTKSYYNGAGEQITIENEKIGTVRIASRPRDFNMASLVIKSTWENVNLVL